MDGNRRWRVGDVVIILAGATLAFAVGERWFVDVVPWGPMRRGVGYADGVTAAGFGLIVVAGTAWVRRRRSVVVASALISLCVVSAMGLIGYLATRHTVGSGATSIGALSAAAYFEVRAFDRGGRASDAFHVLLAALATALIAYRLHTGEHTFFGALHRRDAIFVALGATVGMFAGAFLNLVTFTRAARRPPPSRRQSRWDSS